MKLAFVDGLKYIADPAHMSTRVEDLLSDAYAEERRRLIGKEALQPEPGTPPREERYTWQPPMVKEIWFHTFKAITWVLVRVW